MVRASSSVSVISWTCPPVIPAFSKSSTASSPSRYPFRIPTTTYSTVNSSRFESAPPEFNLFQRICSTKGPGWHGKYTEGYEFEGDENGCPNKAGRYRCKYFAAGAKM